MGVGERGVFYGWYYMASSMWLCIRPVVWLDKTLALICIRGVHW